MDFASCSSTVVNKEAIYLSEGAISLLLDHLCGLAKHDKLYTKFVVVSNYKTQAVGTRMMIDRFV